jgi:hypothetical protein
MHGRDLKKETDMRVRETDKHITYTYIQTQKRERKCKIFTVDRGLFSSYKIQRSVGVLSSLSRGRERQHCPCSS